MPLDPVSRRMHQRKVHHPPSRFEALAGWLAVLAIAGLAVATVGAASPPAPTGDPSTAATVTAAAEVGQQLFLQSCAACHAAGGQGTANGPDITNAGEALTDFVLRTGRMPLSAPGAPMVRKPPVFNDSQIRALVAFVGSLGGGPAIPNVVVNGADLVAGRDLFTANCAACHGPAGGGGAVGGGFTAPDLYQADPTTVGEAVVSGPGPMPVFSFTPTQLNNLAGYVVQLRQAPHPGGLIVPGAGTVTEGAVAALVLIVMLLLVRWIAVRGGHEGGPEGGHAGGHERGPEGGHG